MFNWTNHATAGMCLLDTTDGALMLALYTSSGFAQDQIAILYYSIVLTIITIIVAIVIGTLQLLSLILHVAEPTGKFWDGVKAAGDAYDIIGGCIIGSFVVFGTLSMLVYRPWRRKMNKLYVEVAEPQETQGPGVTERVGATEQDGGGHITKAPST